MRKLLVRLSIGAHKRTLLLKDLPPIPNRT